MSSFTALETSIYLLSRRDHGRYELLQKLKAKGYPEDDAEYAVQYCVESNYLNDLRYAQSQVRQHISKGHGVNRIRQELSFKRVEEELINQALESEQTDWFELAKETAYKKFKGIKAADQKEYAKQVRFLQYRGFSFDQINYALTESS
ncbi:recombination regulator RecX [Vibrio sp. JC009]|uniref:recombination regulator RecX n=1 Tax=Vibrio sp. JC009 TaxID=2912314 RepID=UPI0023B09190|nr:recombination regulator RecX [Vibrio sp. JC009]WED21410.1 recombination regulator RecX [Vibrio sp. JC009]